MSTSKTLSGELKQIYTSVLGPKIQTTTSNKTLRQEIAVTKDESNRLNEILGRNSTLKAYYLYLGELEKIYPGISKLTKEEYHKIFDAATALLRNRHTKTLGAVVKNDKIDSCNIACDIDYASEYDFTNYVWVLAHNACDNDWSCQDLAWNDWWSETQRIDGLVANCKYNCYSNFIYSGVSYNSTTGMLEFASQADFNEVVTDLETKYEAHQAAFFDSKDSWTDDDINDFAENVGFDEFLPLRNFETLFGISSLRSVIEEETETWLNNSTISASDYPENNYGIEDVIEQTLFNESGQVKIGGLISGPITTPIITNYTDCFYRGRKSDDEEYSTSPVKKVLMKLVVDGNSTWYGGARFKGKCISFKKSGSRFKKYATKMSVRLYGDAYVFELCDQPVGFDIGNSIKRRYHRKNKHTVNYGNTNLGTRPGHFTGEFNINGTTKALAF